MRSETPSQQPVVIMGSLTLGGRAAILASACCLGPLLLVLFGVMGAWIGNLTRLEPYRLVLRVAAHFSAGAPVRFVP